MSDYSEEPQMSRRLYALIGKMTDPLEKILAEALDKSGFDFLTDHEEKRLTSSLDFLLVPENIHIEVTRAYSPRKIAQLGRAPEIIYVQGVKATEFISSLITKNRNQDSLIAELTKERDGYKEFADTLLAEIKILKEEIREEHTANGQFGVGA